MATISSKKLLPSSEGKKQVFLVPLNNIVPSTPKLEGITPVEKKAGSKTTVVGEKITEVTRLFRYGLLLKERDRKRKIRLNERKKREERETKLEEKKLGRKGEQEKLAIKIPGSSIFDRLKTFLGFTLFGFIFNNYSKYLPRLLALGKVIKPAIEGFLNFSETIFSATVTFIDEGYKAYDAVGKWVEDIGGENAKALFDKFSKELNLYLNAAILIGLTGIRGGAFTPGRGPRGGSQKPKPPGRPPGTGTGAGFASGFASGFAFCELKGKISARQINATARSLANAAEKGASAEVIEKKTKRIIKKLAETAVPVGATGAYSTPKGIDPRGGGRNVNKGGGFARTPGSTGSQGPIRIGSRSIPDNVLVNKILNNKTFNKSFVEFLKNSKELRNRGFDLRGINSINDFAQLQGITIDQAVRSQLQNYRDYQNLRTSGAVARELKRAFPDTPTKPGVIGPEGPTSTIPKPTIPKPTPTGGMFSRFKRFFRAGAVPLIGGVIDFVINLLSGERVDKAAVRAIGSGLGGWGGSALGTAITGAVGFFSGGIGLLLAPVIVGGLGVAGAILGDILFGMIYDGLAGVIGGTRGYSQGGVIESRKIAVRQSPERKNNIVQPSPMGFRAEKKYKDYYNKGNQKTPYTLLRDAHRELSEMGGFFGSLLSGTVALLNGQVFDSVLLNYVGAAFGRSTRRQLETSGMTVVNMLRNEVGITTNPNPNPNTSPPPSGTPPPQPPNGTNGRLRQSQLTKVGKLSGRPTGGPYWYGNDAYLEHTAAKYFIKAKEAARKEGITITINSAYRSYEHQQALVGLYPVVAAPGTSAHGLGIALDIEVDAGWYWLKDNGSKYGWQWSQIPNDDVHFEFVGAPQLLSKTRSSTNLGTLASAKILSTNTSYEKESNNVLMVRTIIQPEIIMS